MRKRITAGLLLVLALATSATGQQPPVKFDGNWLLRTLELPRDNPEFGFAFGYIVGATNAFRLADTREL
jgi:hypothetical protein